jgi:hypothetical protein
MNFDELIEEISGEATDKFLHSLLKIMDVAFKKKSYLDVLIPGLIKFRRNLDGFEGRYLFISEDGAICEAATFAGNDMKVKKDLTTTERAVKNWDVVVKFKTAKGLRDFLFSSDQDIINLILTNDVEVEGNLNYLFKFGFMSKDLLRRTGMDRVQLN